MQSVHAAALLHQLNAWPQLAVPEGPCIVCAVTAGSYSFPVPARQPLPKLHRARREMQGLCRCWLAVAGCGGGEQVGLKRSVCQSCSGLMTQPWAFLGAVQVGDAQLLSAARRNSRTAFSDALRRPEDVAALGTISSASTSGAAPAEAGKNEASFPVAWASNTAG